MTKAGGVDRSHARSKGPKFAFAALHAAVVAVCLWLIFGGFDWPDPTRTKVLALCAVLYFLRNLVTLFVLLQRKVRYSEGLGLTVSIAVLEIGFLLLGSGILSGEATAFGWVDWLAIGLVLFGSYLNTWSELQRHLWKKQPSSKGRCYTEGLFAFSMHINYFGDTVLFTGWALLTASVFALAIPILITVLFVVFHIPALDAYLSDRYGDEFRAYANRTRKLVPFLY